MLSPMKLVGATCINYEMHFHKLLIAWTSSNISFPPFSQFSVAVIACFLICWTPFHVSRMMFVIATKTEKWNRALKEIQTVLHYVSGKFYFTSFYKKYINTSIVVYTETCSYVEKCNSF